ncbi:MAG: hypothetical protein D3910_20575, partial [Candidatus Electrothrix sp. ATG2]|nr:hypothetical protein [Candidatus Electrothrix sp. ATG2]
NKYSSDPTTVPSADWKVIRETTDYESFAVYFLINEIAKDPDGYHKSTFMVKNKNVCYAGPLWDKNKSYGNVATLGSNDKTYTSPKGWLFNLAGQSPVWWLVLLWDPEFCKKVWSVWSKNSTTGGVLTADWMQGIVNSNVTYITNSGALDRDSERWPSAYNQPLSNYTNQVTILNTYLSDRLTWINGQLKPLLKKYSRYVPDS